MRGRVGRVSGLAVGIVVAFFALAASASVAEAPPPTGADAARAIDSRGAFTCDFGLSPAVSPDEVGPTIERDRMFMAERPGMIHKHIPFSVDPVDGEPKSGGRYLFDTLEQARGYFRWVREEFVLDGVPFLEREEFVDPECRAWATVMAREFAPIRTAHFTTRTERWDVPESVSFWSLRNVMLDLASESEARGHAGVWMLFDEDDDVVSVVYFADRLAPVDVTPDAGLVTLAAEPPLGDTVAEHGWERVFDATQWVLNVWFPYAFADRGEAALWPNSPLLPEPTTSDGVCVPSRGETYYTARSDCLPSCGNGRPDAGETTRNCPSDVRTLG